MASSTRPAQVNVLQDTASLVFAKQYGLDEEEQQEWRSLVAEMAACAFEGYRGDLLLADAIGERLGLSESKRLASV